MTTAKKAAPKKAAKKSARKPNAAFMTPLTPSDKLAEVIGTKPAPRTEIVKKMWEYIKKNNLQDSKNKRMINADDMNLFSVVDTPEDAVKVIDEFYSKYLLSPNF